MPRSFLLPAKRYSRQRASFVWKLFLFRAIDPIGQGLRSVKIPRLVESVIFRQNRRDHSGKIEAKGGKPRSRQSAGYAEKAEHRAKDREK